MIYAIYTLDLLIYISDFWFVVICTADSWFMSWFLLIYPILYEIPGSVGPLGHQLLMV